MTLLDANTLLRWVQPSHPLYADARAAIRRERRAGKRLVIFPQVVYEFWVVATRPVVVNGLGMTVPECEAEVRRIKRIFSLLNDRPTLFDKWEALVVAHACQGKVAHDARLVAGMKTYGFAEIMTFNGGDFRRYPGVTVIDPRTPPAGPNVAGP